MNQPKLQIALDTTKPEFALEVVGDLGNLVDIVEIGTPLLLTEGLRFVSLLRRLYPKMTILADTKIIDSGEILATSAFQAGANIVTVVGAASETTIQKAVDAAQGYSGKVLLDHFSTDWNAADVLKKSELGVDYLGLHLPKDLRDSTSLNPEQLKEQLSHFSKPVFLAGGIDPELISKMKGQALGGFVIGKYLINGPDRVKKAMIVREILDHWQ